MEKNIKTAYMTLLAGLVSLALVIQFYITILTFLADGRTLGGALVHLGSYFTIQNNFLVAVGMTVLLLWPKSKFGRVFSNPSVLTAMGVYIIIVALVYQLVLRQQHAQHGWLAFSNEIFHTVCPAMYMLFWLRFVEKPKLAWRQAVNWLAYPLMYCVYILVRGAVSGYYPYSFINAKLTNMQVLVNCFFC
jgi:hypothetical protein